MRLRGGPGRRSSKTWLNVMGQVSPTGRAYDIHTGVGGSDPTAIHEGVSGEINQITEKTTPVAADLLVIEDSAASSAKKKVQIGNLPGSAVLGFSAAGAAVSGGATNFLGFGTGNVTATEANAQLKAPRAGTLQNMHIYVSANAGTAGSIRINIGGSTSGITVDPASSTGVLSDTSNTAAVSAGDLLSIRVSHDGNITVEAFSVELI